MPGPEKIEITLLGRFEVRRNDCPVTIPPGQQRIVLAALALNRGDVVPIETLTDYLWEAAPPTDPRAGVQNNVLRLRRLLGPGCVATAPHGYRLDIPADRIDVYQFLALTDQVTTDPGVREPVDRALDLWQGAPLSDVGSSGLERDYLTMLTERYLIVVEIRADQDIAERRYARVIADLRALTGRYRLRETLWERLLTALERAGRAAEALEAYEEVRGCLADELGANPSAALQQLHVRLLTAATDLGSGVGTDVATTKQPGSADSAPSEILDAAQAAERAVPRQLPYRVPGFIGRESELAELDGLCVSQPDTGSRGGVAVLHGIGGIGKTALAVQWAYRVRDRARGTDALRARRPSCADRAGQRAGHRACLAAPSRSRERCPDHQPEPAAGSDRSCGRALHRGARAHCGRVRRPHTSHRQQRRLRDRRTGGPVPWTAAGTADRRRTAPTGRASGNPRVADLHR